jgi:hypothetical protein
MDNKKLAKRLSKIVFKPNLTDEDYAVQLYVEKTCLPKGTLGYSRKAIGQAILQTLEEADQ